MRIVITFLILGAICSTTALIFSIVEDNEVAYGEHRSKEMELLEVIQVEMEKAYFEGQKDYADGDIRIQKMNDSTYTWSKSPWDSGDEPLFRPSLKPDTIHLHELEEPPTNGNYYIKYDK